MKDISKALFVAAALVLSGTATAAATDEIKSLVDAGDYARAYSLAQENMDELEGDPNFDFNLGLAALETGNYSDAIFALERVLLRFPDQQRVRLELARAQFGIGNLAAARREFEAVLDTNPPAAVRRNINAFLARIEDAQRGESKQSNLLLFAETFGGYDSNVNSATDDSAVQLPIGVIVNLGKSGTEIDDAFVRVGAGAAYQQARSQTQAFDVSAAVSRRELLSGDDFDLTFGQVGGGYTFMFGDHRLRLGARGLMIGLDTSRFQDQVGVSANWLYEHKSGFVLSAGLNGSIINYNDDPLRDTKQALLTAGAARKFGMVNHSVNVFGAVEPADNDGLGKHNGKNFGGLSYRANWNVNDKIAPFVRAQIQYSKYDEQQPVFGKTRDDTFFNIGAGVTWQFRENWLARGTLSYAKQDSNISVFSYDRTQIEAGVTYALPR